jgi:hypothetical protein
MTDADRGRFGELLALLGEAFNEPVSAARATAYWLALEDEDYATVHAGVQAALKECTFFPKPADIRRCAGATPVGAAWVNRMLSDGISGRPVGAFVELFASRLGGWRAVEDRLPLDRLPFVERLYPGIVAACRAREIPIPTERSVLATDTARLQITTEPTLLFGSPDRGDDQED